VTPERRPRRRRIARSAALFALGGLLAFLATDHPARFLIVDDPPAPSDAIVVMAGATAVALMRSEKVATLIVTGGEPGPGDSAESLRAKAIELGTPAARIRVESLSHSTREAVLAVAPILRSLQARTVTVVTSPYHQRRAAAAARRAWPGIEVRSRAASPSAWSPHRWWTTSASRRVVLTEYAKLLYYGVRGWL